MRSKFLQEPQSANKLSLAKCHSLEINDYFNFYIVENTRSIQLKRSYLHIKNNY